jgi:hypothetical protein
MSQPAMLDTEWDLIKVNPNPWDFYIYIVILLLNQTVANIQRVLKGESRESPPGIKHRHDLALHPVKILFTGYIRHSSSCPQRMIWTQERFLQIDYTTPQAMWGFGGYPQEEKKIL